MALFELKWLRRLVRKYTNPMPIDKASSMKKRLSFVYMLLAWNAFGFVCYMVYTGKSDWARYHGLKTEEETKLPPAYQWSKTLGIDNAQVYRFSGIKKQKEYTIQEGNIVEGERKEELST